MSTDEPDFLIRLRPCPDAVPAVTRLKRLLKMARRGYGLRCIEAQEVKPDGEAVNVEVHDDAAR
jgi:hypothetical protein